MADNLFNYRIAGSGFSVPLKLNPLNLLDELASDETMLSDDEKYKKENEYTAKTVIEVPISIGDIIYRIPSKTNYELNVINGYEKNNRVYEQRVESIQWWNNDRYLVTTCEGMQSVLSDTLGEIWFLQKENALWKLEQLKEESNHLIN